MKFFQIMIATDRVNQRLPADKAKELFQRILTLLKTGSK